MALIKFGCFKSYIFLLLLLLIFKFGAFRPHYKHSSIERNLKKCVWEREVPNNGHQHLWKLEEISNKCDRWCRCEKRRRERNPNWEEGWRNNNFTFFSVRSTTTSSHRNKNVSLLNENERFVDVLEGESGAACVYIKTIFIDDLNIWMGNGVGASCIYVENDMCDAAKVEISSLAVYNVIICRWNWDVCNFT